MGKKFDFQSLCLISKFHKSITIYVSLQLRMQNRRRKWHFPLIFQNGIIWTSPFPLNICNAINWAGAFSKAVVLQKHLFWYSLKMPACMIIFQNLFSKKHCTCTNIQMVMSGYHFVNLKFVHLSKNMPTEHQHLITVLAYRKYCGRRFKYHPWTSQGNNICITELL